MDAASDAIRRAVFLPLQIYLAVYFAALVIVFTRRRHLQPLRERPYWTTIGTLLGATVYGWEVCMRWVWGTGHPCFVCPLYTWPAWLCMINCLLIRYALHIYYIATSPYCFSS